MSSKFPAIVLIVLVVVSGSEGWRRRRSGPPVTDVKTREGELTPSSLAQRSEKVRATCRLYVLTRCRSSGMPAGLFYAFLAY